MSSSAESKRDKLLKKVLVTKYHSYCEITYNIASLLKLTSVALVSIIRVLDKLKEYDERVRFIECMKELIMNVIGIRVYADKLIKELMKFTKYIKRFFF